MDDPKTKSMLESLQEFIKNHPEKIEEFSNKIRQENGRFRNWCNRFDKWLNDGGDFYNLLNKLIKKNGEERKEYCYSKGVTPYPTPLLNFIYLYILERYSPVYNDVIEKKLHPFYSGSYFIKGYWFAMISGQGESVWYIYDKEYKLISKI